MSTSCLLQRLTMLALMSAACLAQAAVEARFVKPESYIDAKSNAAEKEQVLQGLEQHLLALGQRVANDSQKLVIEVLDVDLAGQDKPIMSMGGANIRVLKPNSPPAMQLRYTLSSDSGAVLRSGTARVLDLAYQQHANRYRSDDPQRYEKAMLDRWFADEFGGPTAVAAGQSMKKP